MCAGIKGSAEQDSSHEAEAVIRGTGQKGLEQYKYVQNTSTVAIQGLKTILLYDVLAVQLKGERPKSVASV